MKCALNRCRANMDHRDGACWIAIGAGVGLLPERSGVGHQSWRADVGAALGAYSDTPTLGKRGDRGDVVAAAPIPMTATRIFWHALARGGDLISAVQIAYRLQLRRRPEL